MFRFVSNKVPLATMAASIVRFQSSSVVGETGAAARSYPSRRKFAPTRFLPRFEIHDVRDEAAQGSMTRVAVDGKQLLISQFPQLGTRKADPNDTTPQFDRERRISLRFRHMDLAALVCVVEGRLPRHHMVNNAYELDFEKTPTGYALKGQVHRGASTTKEEWGLRFEKQFAVTMEHFLQSALRESFGFAEHQHAMAEQTARAEGNNNNNNSNRNQNNNNNNNRRNNNRNKRRNNEKGNGNDAKSEAEAGTTESN